MQATTDLSSTQWQVAHAIACQLVLDNTDVNELRKAIAYLRANLGRDKAGKQFFDYLKLLVKNSNTIGHSKQTVTYYKSLDATCDKYLKNYQDEAPLMLTILGWSARLMKYYKSVPIGETQPIEVMSEREAEIQSVIQENTFFVGQQLEAKVTAIKNNRVTYEMKGTIKLTQREPKRANDMIEEQMVKVEIIQLRNGSPKKIRLLSKN